MGLILLEDEGKKLREEMGSEVVGKKGKKMWELGGSV